MRKISAGWRLTGKSWGVLREHRMLLLFPFYGGLSMLVVLALAVAPGMYLIDTHEAGPGVPLVAVGVYLLSFISIYTGVALAACADAIFHGREVGIRDGLQVARSRLGSIAGWALISAIVGWILTSADNGGKLSRGVVADMLSATWSLITFLAVPVITLEGPGPFSTLRRSATIFKERWTDQVTGQVAIGGLVLLLGVLPAIAIGIAGGVLWVDDGNAAEVAGGAVLLAIGVAILALSILVLQGLRGVFGVALYRYATTGEASGPFEANELESAVAARGQARL